MATLTTRADFPHFYGTEMLPLLSGLIGTRLTRWPMEYSQIFRVRKSDKEFEQFSTISGVGRFELINEGGAVPYDKPVQGFKKTFRYSRFGLAVATTRDMMINDKIGEVTQLHEELADSEMESQELQAAQHFNNAFSAGAFAGPDGVALCSASHPLVKQGGVQSNILGTPADLDVASLQLAMTALETMVRSNGNLFRWRAGKLVVAPPNRWIAAEITRSNQRPDTANNAINALRFADGGMPEVFVWHYLTDPDAWFLVSDQNGLKWYFRERPYSHSWIEDVTETGNFARRYAASSGFNDYVGVFGTAGA